ncbi:hypothetical protein CWE09_02215 [Aliidiomarina minuta]|uniref:Uncharacterized protein n=1 Tax=Aliidiomarina minuta TaxID=880057 RepID=A0A432W678_9GAMM|nr:hypothetical protein [Aliidiomarina minuta]RUO25570.1 hypothetical protein CWE09_02215 [Aliidiomarina minuta]
MKLYRLIAIVFILLISGCATPPQVKQLSVKQMDYFDSAVLAVSIQSEALLMTTERLVSDAKARIDAEEKQNRARLTSLVQQGGLDQEQAAEVTRRVAERAAQAISAKNKLDQDFAAIKEKTQELNAYLVKMKEVHIAIDAYVQSEKAGETVMNDVLNQRSIQTLLATVNDLTSRIESGSSELRSLVEAL